MPSQSAGYAAGTEVPATKSRAEIEHTLERFGATGFSYGWMAERNVAQIEFLLGERQMRFTLELPDRSERRFTVDGRGRRRTETGIRAAYDQEVRRLWRSMLLVIKAKLEAVKSGIVTVEQEFLAHIVLPDGSVVGDWANDQLKAVYGGGQMPALLPGSAGR